jgi:D-alanyl-D-alanine carboxypeptidase
MRPDVAVAFHRMAAGARRGAGLTLLVTSGHRSDAEQAKLFAAHPDPKWVAPPGTSLHRYATELDLGPPAAYGWLGENCRRFGFIKCYAWVAHKIRCRGPALAGATSGSLRSPGGDTGGDGISRRSSLPPLRSRGTGIG